MVSCKDCLHIDVCEIRTCYMCDGFACDDCEIHSNYGKIPSIKNCKYFKDRNRFVDLPCNIGDTVYYFLNHSDYKKYEAVEVIGFHIDKYRTAFQIEICGYKILVDIEFLGEKIFLTQEEAERVLNSLEKPNS